MTVDLCYCIHKSSTASATRRMRQQPYTHGRRQDSPQTGYMEAARWDWPLALKKMAPKKVHWYWASQHWRSQAHTENAKKVYTKFIREHEILRVTHSISQALLYRRGQHNRWYHQYKKEEGHVEQPSRDRTLNLVTETTQPTSGRATATKQQIQATHGHTLNDCLTPRYVQGEV